MWHLEFQQVNSVCCSEECEEAFFAESILEISPIDHILDMISRQIVYCCSSAVTGNELWTRIEAS